MPTKVSERDQLLSLGLEYRFPMDNDTFKTICERVATEEDPKIIELFKRRMEMLLTEIPDLTLREEARLN